MELTNTEKLKKITSRLSDKVPPYVYFLCWLLIKIVYDLSAVLILGKQYYVGYGSYGIDFSWTKELFSFLPFTLMGFYFSCFSKKGSTFRSVALNVLFLIYYIPLNSSFAVHNESWMYCLLSNVYCFLLLFFTLNIDKIDKRICSLGIIKKLSGKKAAAQEKMCGNVLMKSRGGYDNTMLMAFLIISAFSVIIFKFYYNGFHFSFSIFSDSIYDRRGDYSAYMMKIAGSVLAYLITVVVNFASYSLPALLYFGLKRKNIFEIVLAVVAFFCMFSVSSGKSTLLYIAVAVFVFLYDRFLNMKKFNEVFGLLLLAALIGCVLIYLIFKSSKIYGLVFRREMFIPAWMNSLYYDFFSRNPKVYWSQSTFFFQNILHAGYSAAPVELINNAFFNGEVPSPNTGLFADAYLNFGVAGVLIYPVLLSAVIHYSGKIFRKIGKGFEAFVAVKLVIGLTNVQLLRTDFVFSYFLFTFVVWCVYFLLPDVNIGVFKKKKNQNTA